MPSGAELTEAIPSDPQRRPVLTPSRSRRRHDHVSNDDIFLRAAGWTGGLATARVDRVRSSSKLDSPTRIALKANRSEEHTSELQSLMRISYAVFCLKKKKHIKKTTTIQK